MANLNQLKCPSCGAVLSLSIPDQIVVECPYCHQQVVNTDAYKTANVDKGEEPRILEFKLEVKDVINLLINDLINDQNVPRDIFDKMRISSTMQYYVPMYIFEGTYRAPWSAEVPRHEKRQSIDYNGKIKEYFETVYDYHNGEAAGNFICNCIPYKIITRLDLNDSYIRMLSLSPTSLSVFSQVNIGKDIVLITPSGDADYVWREYGNTIVQDRAISEARQQAPGHMTYCSASCELKKTWMVYIPIWIIEYKYNDENYTYINYAERVDSGSRPYDNEINKTDITTIYAQPTEEQKAVLDKYNKRDGIFSDVRNFGCLSTALIGPIGWGVIEIFDLYGSHSGHYANNFNMYFFFIGLGLVIIMNIIRYFYRLKCGINNIENDIANRTKFLQANAKNRREKELREAEQYRRETGHIFLKTFGSIVGNNSDEIKREKEENYQKKTETDFYESVQPRAKICIKCGKEINSNHLFCRYCGTKQE